MQNVILATFPRRDQAHEGMGELRRLDDEGAVTVRAAAIVERATDGSFRHQEEAEHLGVARSVAGGVIGALVGALAGPLGLLVGGTAGVALGSIADAEEADAADVVVETVAKRVPPGGTALVADLEEESVEALDSIMASAGGTVTRWPRVEVEAELAVAAEALAAAEEEARRVMRERRKARGEETLSDKLADLKDRVTGRDDGS